jgi:hypothetical protein
MIVNCFTITRKIDNPHPIYVIYQEFGTEIPKYLQYEGGSGDNTYLCCVDARINVKKLCETYNYECGTLYQMEVAEDMYNNSYTIYPTYKKEGEQFVLQCLKYFEASTIMRT